VFSRHRQPAHNIIHAVFEPVVAALVWASGQIASRESPLASALGAVYKQSPKGPGAGLTAMTRSHNSNISNRLSIRPSLAQPGLSALMRWSRPAIAPGCRSCSIFSPDAWTNWWIGRSPRPC